MWYWNSDEMALCREMLREGSKKVLGLSQECMEVLGSSQLSKEDSNFWAELSEELRTTAGFEESLAEGIFRIDKIYCKYDEKIRDYFELNVQKAPRTVLGISTFESLREHEKQMPFNARGKSPASAGSGLVTDIS